MRRSVQAAAQTRHRIVAAGVDRSSVHGVMGLSLGSLAATLQMSKAGVVGPFGTRQALQLAVIARAGAMFTATVVEPSLGSPAGLARLRTVISSWCCYLADSPFPNGCFVTAASSELDGQLGELRDAMQGLISRWRAFLREQITAAQSNGDLDPGADAEDLVSTLNGLAMAANQEIQLLGDSTAGARANRLMLSYLDGYRC